jgi:transcriptional regulator with XRE-family HTH domain
MPRASCDEIFNLMRGTVSNWENGFAEPEEDLLPDIAGFFSIRLSELLSDAPLIC